MNESSQLVFYGEILPGHDIDIVKARLGELLKLPAEQIGAVFSGRKVVLRKSLPSEQAASYVARLEKIGVRVFAEAIPRHVEVGAASGGVPEDTSKTVAPEPSPVAATIPSPQFAPSTPAVVEAAVVPLVQPPAVEEMECPKCGERQPRRTLCRACSVDMKRFAESRQQAEQAAREERMLAREAAQIERGRGPRVSVDCAESVGVFGFGLSGRTGRINYWVGGLPILATAVLSLWLATKSGVAAIGIIGVLLAMYLALRLSVLRCHDLNWSGWFALLMCIPYAGALFGLILGFMPGTRGDNPHGPPSRIVGVPAAIGMLAVCGVSVALAMSQTDALVKNHLMAGAGREASRPADGGGLTVAEADVEMFTTSDCGVCHMAKAYMNKRGITYAEKDVEKNEEYLRDFYARGGRGVPYIFVGNQSMMGFDADRLEQMLAANRT